MIIKILGSGCKKCITLAENTQAALSNLGLNAEVVKVTDFAAIAAHGVMSTPGCHQAYRCLQNAASSLE